MPEGSQGVSLPREKLGSPSTWSKRERELQAIHTDFIFCLHDSDPHGDISSINLLATLSNSFLVLCSESMPTVLKMLQWACGRDIVRIFDFQALGIGHLVAE